MKRLTGIVLRTKNTKTAHVEVKSEWMHPKYLKKRMMSTVFACHDLLGVHVGDEVEIVECKPVSATKHFIVETVIKAAPIIEEVKVEKVAEAKTVKPTKAKAVKKVTKTAKKA
ncbi:MAG: 30S ribosomal protein S17 [Candidatus Woesebacteria bacterium]